MRDTCFVRCDWWSLYREEGVGEKVVEGKVYN
jgi:hypothetical protein